MEQKIKTMPKANVVSKKSILEASMKFEDPRKCFIKTFESLCYGCNKGRVFTDFCEMAAIELQQPFYRDPQKEARYISIAEDYPKEKRHLFAELFTCVVFGLEMGFGDFLGNIFHELDLGNDRMGQFFTPWEISKMMSKMTFSQQDVEKEIARKGYITLNEPCSGAGGMVLAFAEVFRAAGFNPSNQLLVLAQDLDFNAANMTYIQLSLAGISAEVRRENTLSMEVFFSHFTPVYFFENWPQRLQVIESWNKIKKILNEKPSPAKTIEVSQLLPANVIIEPSGQMAFNF